LQSLIGTAGLPGSNSKKGQFWQKAASKKAKFSNWKNVE
jgi:hypothetical protein